MFVKYLRRFEREIEEILNPPLSALEKEDMTTLFQEFVKTIDIQNKAYSLSDFRAQFELYLENLDRKGIYFCLAQNFESIFKSKCLNLCEMFH